MKRNELLRKTGICFTAFALSVVIGVANPMITAFGADETTQEDASNSSFDGGFSDDGGGDQDTEIDPEPIDPEPLDPEPLDPDAGEGGSDDSGTGQSEPSSGDNADENTTNDGQQKGDDTTDNTNNGQQENSGEGDTSGNQTDSSDSGSTEQNTSDDSNENSPTSDSDSSQTDPGTVVDTNPVTGDETNTGTVTDDNTVTTTPVNPAEAETGGTAASEPVSADTQTSQPRQTTIPVEPTGTYKDVGTTLNPGEVPGGYEQALNYGSTNEQLIASQNIVSGLSIIKDDFRFYTIDKVPAIAEKKLSVYEDMDTESREIGLLSKNNILYILSEEDDGWLYIESGNVRGFVKEDNIRREKDPVSADEMFPFAQETVPASDNKAFAYKRCTTKSTVIDKSYAIADVDTAILESSGDKAREIGHLTPGSLCYVIMQADEKWAYVESGNVRGFARTANLTTGTAAKKLVQQTGEKSMPVADEYIAPSDNKALYYTLNSVHDGVVYSSIRTEIVEAAAKCIGNPYVWGGTSLTNGADCSGFVQTLYSLFGYSLPRVADAQSTYGTQIPISDAAPGDLIFFAANGYVYHVALYAGDGMTIEAYSENRGIIATPIGNRDAVWATRVIED